MPHFSTADEDLGLNSRQFLWGDHKQRMNFTPSTTFTKEQVISINPTFQLDILDHLKGTIYACQSCKRINLISGSFPQLIISVSRETYCYFLTLEIRDPPWEHFPSLGIQGMYGSMIFPRIPRMGSGDSKWSCSSKLRGNPWRNITWWVLKLKLFFPPRM